jgi:nucleolar protein 56
MALYLLYESASGYGLFLAHGLDEIGQNTEAVRNSLSDLNRFGKVVQLTAFHPFESALDALNQCNAVSEGELCSKLQYLLVWLLGFGYHCVKFLWLLGFASDL